jgi:hypothetical protein
MPSLNVLDLNARRLPVSQLPEWAKVYFCDRCGADLTKFVYKGWPRHGGKPIGPETRTCVCGRAYRTGFVEWDHLVFQEQKRYSIGFLPGLLLVAGFAALGIPVAFMTWALLGSWKAGFFGSLLAGVAFALVAKLRLEITIAASRRRTRSLSN